MKCHEGKAKGDEGDSSRDHVVEHEGDGHDVAEHEAIEGVGIHEEPCPEVRPDIIDKGKDNAVACRVDGRPSCHPAKVLLDSFALPPAEKVDEGKSRVGEEPDGSHATEREELVAHEMIRYCHYHQGEQEGSPLVNEERYQKGGDHDGLDIRVVDKEKTPGNPHHYQEKGKSNLLSFLNMFTCEQSSFFHDEEQRQFFF